MKKKLFIIPLAAFMVAGAVGMSACGKIERDEPVQPSDTKTLVGIAVDTPPTKTIYIDGDSFDPTGLKIKATYTDGSSEIVNGWTVNKTTLTVSDNSVTISYTKDNVTLTTVISITVNPKADPGTKTLTGIAITTQPTKLEYKAGEYFDKTGMVVTASYSNSETANVTANVTIDKDGVALTKDDTAVVVSYAEGDIVVRASVSITVSDSPTPPGPVVTTITPQEAIALMDQAGDGVVVAGLQKVKGICASGTQYDSQYKQYTTGFDGVSNFKLQFTDTNNILNGGSPDGMEIVVEGYLEKYNGKYQLSYLPQSASPTGEKFTPNLVSAEAVHHEGVLSSITVSNSHRELYVGGTFIKETVTAHYSDETTADVTSSATFSGYNMSTKGEQTVNVSYTEGDVTKTTSYQITLIERTESTITPAEAIALMDQAGDGVVVSGLQQVKGICASGSQYDSQYKQYTTGFDGVSNFKLQFTDTSNILNGGSPDGMEIVVEGYLEKYNGKYQLSYLPQSASPTGQKFTPNLISATAAAQKEVVGIEEVVSHPDTVYLNGSIAPSSVTLKIKYDDGSFKNVAAESVECDTSAINETATATAHYKTFTKTFTIAVIAKPAPTGESSVYTFTNDKTSSQNMGTWTSADFLKHVVVDGDEVITGIKDITNAYIGGNGGDQKTGTDWNIWNCLKVGKSNAKGSVTLTLDSSIAFETIKVKAIGNRDDGTLTINGITKNVTKKATKENLEPIELEFEVEGGISDLTFSSKDASSGNYGICITEIEFVGGGTPTPQKEISGVELQGTLAKSSYIEGQTFDSTGLSLKVIYDDGSDEIVTSGFTFNVTNPLAVGEYDLKATYEGHTTTGSVHISVVAKELVSITITHGMNTTTYQVGDEWDATGIVVQGTYNDGDAQTLQASSYELSFNPTKATDTDVKSVSIVATMKDGSGISSEAYPQTVAVQTEPVPEPKLDSITVANAQGKTNAYTEGDVISKSDLVVTAHYTEGKADAVVTDYTISLTGALKTTDTSATITYSEDGETKTAAYTFTVSAKPSTQTVEFDLKSTYKEASGEASGVSFAAVKAGGTNDPFHNDDCGLRVYVNNTLTISGSGITKVTFTINECGCEKADADFTADVGSYLGHVWTGTVDKIVFTAGSRQVHVSKIVVECGPAAPAKEIESLGTVTAPTTIYKDATLDTKDVTVAVTYTDKTTGTVNPDSIDLVTSTVSDSVTGTVHVGDLTTTFTIKVVEAPTTKDYEFAYESKTNPTGLTSSVAAGGFETGGRLAQWTSCGGFTISTSNSYSNVTKVIVNTSTNGADNVYKISCTVGGNEFGSTVSMLKNSANEDIVFEDDAADGVVVITYTFTSGTKKSIYVGKVTITAK